LALLPDLNEIALPAELLPGGMLNGSLADNGDSETWLAILRGFAEEPDRPARSNPRYRQDGITSPGSLGPLEKVAPGPWRSLGGYFDYGSWEDRERFLELDAAIARAQHCETRRDPEDFLVTAA
jgi:hypothetical protein